MWCFVCCCTTFKTNNYNLTSQFRENFYVWGYTLSELDFSSNINLKRLDISCENGPLSILDLSNNTNLLNISIEYFNNLSSLDLRNGNNVC